MTWIVVAAIACGVAGFGTVVYIRNEAARRRYLTGPPLPAMARLGISREQTNANVAEYLPPQPCTTAPDGTGAKCTCAYDCRNYWIRAQGMKA